MKRALLVSVGVALAAPTSASALEFEFEFCMVYRAQTVDSDSGEDHYLQNTLWKARGARATVRSYASPNTIVWDGNASQVNGCFEFESTEQQFYVDLYAETRIGASNNITVRGENMDGESPMWTLVTAPALAEGRHYYYGEASPTSNLVAIASFVTYWVDSHSGDPLDTVHTMHVQDKYCEHIPNNSCNDSFDVVAIQPGGDQRKFLIGHEVGHNLYAMFRGGTFGSFNCLENSGGTTCEYDTGIGEDNEHSLHSKELASCALSEGFAHFVAVAAFNRLDQTDGHFQYYKPDYPDAVDAEDGTYGGDLAFMEAECTGDDAGHGVELDWMRAFWNYRTDAGMQPSIADIMGQIDAAHDDAAFEHADAYDFLLDAATDDGFGPRMSTIWDTHGANH